MKHVIRQILLILGTIVLLGSLSSCTRKGSDESKAIAEDKNDEKFDSKSDEKDAQFVVNAVSESYAELLLADAAMKKSMDQEVKDVASLLKKEYSRSLKDLTKYASSRAISVPTEATDADQKRANEFVSEKEFDKTWCGEVRDRHKKMIDDLEEVAASTKDDDLKGWASKELTIARADHDKIMACHERLK
jgi:putative membrane protein